MNLFQNQIQRPRRLESEEERLERQRHNAEEFKKLEDILNEANATGENGELND